MMKLSDDDIIRIAELTARQASERATLACRQQNERGEMDERHQAERKALGIGAPADAAAPAPNGAAPLSSKVGRVVRR